MKPRAWKKIATTSQFKLYRAQGEPQIFSVRWTIDAAANKFGKRVFSAPSIDYALSQAPFIAGLSSHKRVAEVTLDDAFENALKDTSRKDRAVKDWRYSTRQFALWLKEHHPSCGYWHQLSRDIVYSYYEFCKNAPREKTKKKASDNTIRLAFQSIRQTAAYMRRKYGFEDIADGISISTKLCSTPAKVHLEDVLDFIDYLKEKHPELEAGAALQGLAGLRLQEATRLTWNKVDLNKGWVEVSDEVKNDYSQRVIPVCARVVEALKRASKRASNMKVQSISGLILPWESWSTYSHEMTDAIREYKNGILAWTPKDLRNCLPTFAEKSGLSSATWEQYIGHAPKGISPRHYIAKMEGSRGNMEELEKDVAVFRERVVKPLEEAIENATNQEKRERKDA